MSKTPEDKIEEKLRQLEIKMAEESANTLPAQVEKSTALRSGSGAKGTQPAGTTDVIKLSKDQEKLALKADLHMLGGFAALLAGILIFFNHLVVRSPFSFFNFGGGGGGQGILLLLLLVGMGFFFYDYKNKVGWLLIVGSLAAIVFGIFATLQIYFPSMSMLGLLTMFIPIAFGAALLARGMKMHSQIEKKDD